jgi:hypothetical protein
MNVHYRDQELSDSRLELAEKEQLTYLGPNLTLRRCDVIIRLPTSRLHILPTRFIDCSIEVKQELRNFRDWVSSSLKGCRFKGRMSGCDFGNWPGHKSGGELGEVEDCDFTEARLDLCRFIGCDTRTLRFARWPSFTILDPVGRGRELTNVDWPGSFRPVRLEGPFKEWPSTVALSFYAPNEAKRCGTTEAELKAAIERFDFIVH